MLRKSLHARERKGNKKQQIESHDSREKNLLFDLRMNYYLTGHGDPRSADYR
jgi:hypothetical protein